MDWNLYVKEGDQLKLLKVPLYVVKDLLRDRLSKSEINRIHRFSDPTQTPSFFQPGSVVVDFSTRTAQCFQTYVFHSGARCALQIIQDLAIVF
ncbi:hypothetical protein HY772_02805 [Candidatus Woesearchaeota archaeon]|nr:hypothetical protein [Candidatus Woesearchaeota archaeon]